ncbi:MAG: aldolase [Deltaproteobacteria bacterium]|nr:aldolase [Deltaproteobacteria bacterium]
MKQIGRDLFLRGMVNSHSGNMSVKLDNDIYITRTRSMLGRLKRDDIVKVTLLDELPKKTLRKASSETPVHIRIYKETDAKAVIHAHPPYAVLLSFFKVQHQIAPIDSEGKLFLKEIPIVHEEDDKEKRAQKISEVLKDCQIVIVRGHGSFAIGESLEEAYMYTTTLESSCFFIYHLEILKKEVGHEILY